MSVANSQDRIAQAMASKLESFNVALRRRVGVSGPRLFITLKHLGELSQDRAGEWDRLTRGCQIQLSKKTTALNDRRIKTCVDRFTSVV